jgi:CDP-4-dehydro-6-deoxyglucose reductase, E3
MSYSVQINLKQPFRIGEGQTILAAADAAGVNIPYSCRNGRCSSCKCKVIKGETRAINEEYGLSAKEKADGWILSCVRIANTELELEVEDLDGFDLPDATILPCRIQSIDAVAPDVLRVVMRLPPSAKFKFLPGQYIDVNGPGEIRRSYSLARAGEADQKLEIHIRAVDGGAMSQYWFRQAKVNDLLRLNGPLGTFFLREISDLDLIFLATGTGVAPVKAMLESMVTLQTDQLPRSVTVLWGGRTQQDLYLELASLPVKYRYVPVLSRAGDDWTGARGHVQQVLLSLEPDLRNAAVYACGSDAMIQGAKLSLMDAGLPAHRFYSDAFVCSAPN